MKDTAIINFKIEIEAEHLKQAEYIASKAIPTHSGFMDGNTHSFRPYGWQYPLISALWMAMAGQEHS